ncbi:hypothetical protein E2C01_068125 [Portunus trituberculatus]|uniref:Uncharacterized protein n=1 Tax=Portunus trituberculatus TaxID=210409 RepID=A0A5B7HYM5_PORTR|nr:hypothetical protein [Portunus trituberculatus]
MWPDVYLSEERSHIPLPPCPLTLAPSSPILPPPKASNIPASLPVSLPSFSPTNTTTTTMLKLAGSRIGREQ